MVARLLVLSEIGNLSRPVFHHRIASLSADPNSCSHALRV